MGKLLAIFPTMYLSGGTCVLYIITGGKALESFYQVICWDDIECNSRSLRGTEWFLMFICLAILVAQFFPNLDSLAHISFIGSITAVAYCSLIWILSIITKVRPDQKDPWEAKISGLDRICNILNGLGIIALAFRGHNVVLEIQVTHLNPCSVSISHFCFFFEEYFFTAGDYAYKQKTSIARAYVERSVYIISTNFSVFISSCNCWILDLWKYG